MQSYLSLKSNLIHFVHTQIRFINKLIDFNLNNYTKPMKQLTLLIVIKTSIRPIITQEFSK